MSTVPSLKLQNVQVYYCARCGAPNHGLSLLSRREKQIVKGYAAGLRNYQIMEKLGIAKQTVAEYKSKARAKLGLENDADWMNFLSALRAGRIKS